MNMRTSLLRAPAATVVVVGLLLAVGLTGRAVAAAPPAGPPYPDPVAGQRVYDYAGIFSSNTIASAERTIAAIEARTGAQVAVYTQVKPQSDTPDAANADALDLMNQWGVGRKGFDDGLVILFDMESNLRHGQVSLYAGSGFKGAFLSNSDRQAIFDNEMLPRLRDGDFDGALDAAVGAVDAAATPAHADELNRARIFNALVGFAVLVIGVGLAIFALLRWYTHGRDPDYVDDDSVLMPAPPPDLTPAMATLLVDDRTSARTVSAAMVDLAARGRIAFLEAGKRKTSLQVGPETSWLPGPEGDLERAIRSTAGPAGIVEASEMHGLSSAVGSLKSDLERLAVERKWLTGRPSRVIGAWFIVAAVEAVAAWLLISWSLDVGASGGLLGGAGLIGAAVVTGIVAWFMPCRTKMGAMLTAMLAAYRRTLRYTMAMSSSMDQVAASRAVP